MICFEGIESIIECVYLDDTLCNKTAECNIFVNPYSVRYMTDKIVIINSCEYPEEDIKTLIKNGNTVISRIYFDIDGLIVRPYILKICGNVAWNGKVITEYSEPEDIYQDDMCKLEDYILYFPKIDPSRLMVDCADDYGNLSALGWVLQQVGINIKTDTPFVDLDLIKTKKYINSRVSS